MGENKYLIQFKRPYTFEGVEYTEIDLSGIENVKASDLMEADQEFTRKGFVAAVNEMSIAYACIIAAKVTGKPDVFFTGLPANEAIKIKTVVASFFYEMD